MTEPKFRDVTHRPTKYICNYSNRFVQETEMVKHYMDSSGCDCPAHVHDKELPLELVNKKLPETEPVDNVKYGYSSHFDF